MISLTISKIAMSDLANSIQRPSHSLVTSCVAVVRWEVYGNGRARHWKNMTDSKPWNRILGILVRGTRIPQFCGCVETDVDAADFFDGKHNIVLGGSWATHPRIAGRKSLYVRIALMSEYHMLIVFSVNWYQRNYPYVWAGARLVRE